MSDLSELDIRYDKNALNDILEDIGFWVFEMNIDRFRVKKTTFKFVFYDFKLN